MVVLVVLLGVVVWLVYPWGEEDESGYAYPDQLVNDLQELVDEESGLLVAPVAEQPADTSTTLYATGIGHLIAAYGTQDLPEPSTDVLARACSDSSLDSIEREFFASAALADGSDLPAECAADPVDVAAVAALDGELDDLWLRRVHMLVVERGRELSEADGATLTDLLEAYESHTSESPYLEHLRRAALEALGSDIGPPAASTDVVPGALSGPEDILDAQGAVALWGGDVLPAAVHEQLLEVGTGSTDPFLVLPAAQTLYESGSTDEAARIADTYLDQASSRELDGNMLGLEVQRLGSVVVTYEAALLLGPENFSRIATPQTATSAAATITSQAEPGFADTLTLEVIERYSEGTGSGEDLREDVAQWFADTDCSDQLDECLRVVEAANALDLGPEAEFEFPESFDGEVDEEGVVLRAYSVPGNVTGVRSFDDQGPQLRDKLLTLATSDDPGAVPAAAALSGAELSPSPEELQDMYENVGSRFGCIASDYLVGGPDGDCSVRWTILAVRAGFDIRTLEE